jgi:hypothetical protein
MRPLRGAAGAGNDWLFGELGDEELDDGEGLDWVFGGLTFKHLLMLRR